MAEELSPAVPLLRGLSWPPGRGAVGRNGVSGMHRLAQSSPLGGRAGGRAPVLTQRLAGPLAGGGGRLTYHGRGEGGQRGLPLLGDPVALVEEHPILRGSQSQWPAPGSPSPSEPATLPWSILSLPFSKMDYALADQKSHTNMQSLKGFPATSTPWQGSSTLPKPFLSPPHGAEGWGQLALSMLLHTRPFDCCSPPTFPQGAPELTHSWARASRLPLNRPR